MDNKRVKYTIECNSLEEGLEVVHKLFDNKKYFKAFDILEYMLDSNKFNDIRILVTAYDLYKKLPDRSRYMLYQGREFNFNIGQNDKVLDIGSGHLPFKYATHLADISFDNDSYGRGTRKFEFVENKTAYECSVEDMPFKDKEFDFVYCSHVLEHTNNPQKACEELMRIARRGYIEVPSKSKDLWLNSIKISNHIYNIEYKYDILNFSKYTNKEIDGFNSNILLSMHSNPQTDREKAFSALIYLKSTLVNTMFLWNDNFKVRVEK